MTRIDGRRPDCGRQTRIQPAVLASAEGSALIEVGHTKVICAASVEESVPRFRRGSGSGWVTAEYGMLPRATSTRTQREVQRGRPSGRTAEIQRLIGRSLRTAVDMEALGERTVIIDCDVIQADGGTRTASITGGWVAMALAIQGLLEHDSIPASPIRHYVAATSVGIVDGTPLLDLCYAEDSRAEVDMNVVMTSGGEFVEVQASAEGRTFSESELEAQLELAKAGIRALIETQRKLVNISSNA